LGGIPLLQTLNDEELQQLAACVLIHQVKAGATVIKEGDLSTSMYGLAEGLLQVRVAREGDQDLVIASMEPGEFFGEMSLLAGEPRSATIVAHVDSVVFEIRQRDFSEILEKRRELVDSISHMIAERQVTNSELLDAATPEEREAAVDEAASSLIGRMRGVFSRMKTK
jgi:CRP-like cAMP-binding protein